MKCKCIIFDFDGTIADTSLGIFNSIRHASGKLNLRILNAEELKSHLGPPMHKAYNNSFGISGSELEKAINFHKEYSLSRGFREFEFYPGILEVLEELKKRNYRMGIATTKLDQVIKKICQESDLGKFFDTVNGATGQETKTDIVKRCLECLQANGKASVVGDSDYDLNAATAVNAEFIGVTYGYGFTKKDEKRLNKIANSPEGILNYF